MSRGIILAVLAAYPLSWACSGTSATRDGGLPEAGEVGDAAPQDAVPVTGDAGAPDAPEHSSSDAQVSEGGASANAALASLALEVGTLTPPFDPATTSYAATVAGAGASVDVIATAAQDGAALSVQSGPATFGSISATVPLLSALTTITVEVTAPDGVTRQTYSVVVRLRGWQLTETNTGLAGAGVDRSSLEVYTGSDTPPAGTTISLKKITTPLNLFHGNITVDRCWIQPTTSWGVGSVVFTYDPSFGTAASSPVTIVDSDIDASAVTDTWIYADCATRGIATLQRNHIWGMGSGICVFDGGYQLDAVVEHNYVHGLRGGIVNGSFQSHNESATIRSFGGSRLAFLDNRLISKSGSDSGALFIQAWAGTIDHTTIERNLFETAGWCIPLEANANGYGSDMRCIDNRFVSGGYGPAYVDGGPGWAEWTENYLDDPSEADHKGNAVPQP